MITQNFGTMQPPMLWGLADFYPIAEDVFFILQKPVLPEITFVNLEDEIKFKDKE